MSKGLEALIDLYNHAFQRTMEEFYEKLKTIEKELKALNILISVFDIKIVGDYLIAQRGDVCIVENLKLRQSQELINLLKEVLL